MKARRLFFVSLLLLCSTAGFGQQAFESTLVNPSDSLGQIYLDMPLLTLPSQADAYKTTGGFFRSYMNPGMENSLAYSTDLYTAVHFGLKKALHFENNPFLTQFLSRLAISLFDVLYMQQPLGGSWLHEEYHRAVMTKYGVNSYNEVLNPHFWSSSIAVSHEKDEDLAMLCNTHHSDFVRLMSAGHEGVVDLSRNLQSNSFFYRQNLDNEVLYWMHGMQNLIYLFSCASGKGDKGMQERNQKELEVSMRDFTGMDMNAWIYELLEPDRPYEARGIHPSGVGINRYIMSDQIPEVGMKYLGKQALLDIFNLVSPMMVGFTRFRLAQTEQGSYYGNFAFRHYLTSFGDDVSLDLYLQAPWANLYATLHSYNNLEHHFGGLETGLVDYPLFDGKMQLGGTVMAWVQPKDQLFKTSSGSFGGLVKARVNYHSRVVDPYLEAGWKSKGWVAGNANLDNGFFCRAGLRWQIGR